MSYMIENLKYLSFKLCGKGELEDAASDAIDGAIIEIERLRADLAIKQNCCDGAAAQDAHVRQEREKHRAEAEKLRAENERLRENVDRLGKEVERADRLREEIARVKADNRYLVKRALEGKP